MEMRSIAKKIVEQQSGDFDPVEFGDRYGEAARTVSTMSNVRLGVKSRNRGACG